MITTLKTAALKEPIGLAEVKEHLRLELSDIAEDDNLIALIRSARSMAENITGRKLITQTWYYYLQDWPIRDYIILPYGSLQSVTAVTYTDSSETSNTFSSTYYYADSDSDPGRVVLRYGDVWPSDTLDSKNPIRIEFTCGYGLNPSDVPQPIRQAMKLMISADYNNRLPTQPEDRAIHTKLANYRLFWSFE